MPGSAHTDLGGNAATSHDPERVLARSATCDGLLFTFWSLGESRVVDNVFESDTGIRLDRDGELLVGWNLPPCRGGDSLVGNSPIASSRVGNSSLNLEVTLCALSQRPEFQLAK